MSNVEYWEARELMPLLGYRNKWQNFVDVITKAMVSCETTGNIVTDHFTDASKMVGIGSGGWCWFSGVWSLFHDTGYLGQYTLDAENIRIYKGIPEAFTTLLANESASQIGSVPGRPQGIDPTMVRLRKLVYAWEYRNVSVPSP